MYLKIKFMAKILSDLCNFYGKVVVFYYFCLRNAFLLFFAEFILLIHNNIVKFSEKIEQGQLI